MQWKSANSAVALGLMTALILTACGGGGSSATGTVGQGSGELPGVQNSGSNSGSNGSGSGSGSGAGNGSGGSHPSTVVEIETPSDTAAPLGLDMAYEPSELTGDVMGFVPAKDSSALVQGQNPNPNVSDTVITNNNAPPNWTSTTTPTFNPGQEVDVWIRVDIPAAGDYTISFKAPDIYLDYTQPSQHFDAAGTYDIKVDYVIPYNTTVTGANLTENVTSGSFTDAGDPYTYNVSNSGGTTTRIYYPDSPDNENDVQGGGGGCLPRDIDVEFHGTFITVTCDKNLSNVVLRFTDGKTQKWDSLTGYVGTFSGTGSNAGKQIIGAWVHSGCNASGDGPGYGEYFANDDGHQYNLGMAQVCYEDLLTGSDYDYNDFLARMNVKEFRNGAGNLVQIQLTIKAVARAAGYDSDWQFNLDGAFPGATAIAIVDQIHPDGTRNGLQRIWRSNQGTSIPIFTPIRNALPNPPGSTITNGVPGTQFIDGDWAYVTIVFNNPVQQGTYTALPYKPQLRVHASGNTVYTIDVWKKKGDSVDSNGKPLAFVVPDTFAWALEGKPINTVYTGFNSWIQWINNQISTEPNPAWWDHAPAKDFFQRNLFL